MGDVRFGLQEIGKGGAREDFVDAVLCLGKHGAESATTHAGGGDNAFGFISHTFLQGEDALDTMQDLKQRDFTGGLGEAKAAARAAMRADETGLRERLEDFRQKALRDAFGFADLVDHDHALGRLFGQIQQPDNRVFACPCDLHV